jgi:phosphoribosylpyrophosphate synthetase
MSDVLIIPTLQARHISDKIRDGMTDHDFDFTFVGGNIDGMDEFPDKEIYTAIPKIEKIDGRDVIILHGGAPRPNSSQLSLFHVLQSIRKPIKGWKDESGVKHQVPLNVRPKSLNIFFTYFTGGKQDWVDRTGAVNAAELYLEICRKFFGVDRFFTVDAHFTLDEWANKYPLTNVSAVDLLIEAAKRDGYGDYEIYGPDEGSERMSIQKRIKKDRLNSYKDALRHGKGELKRMFKGRKIYLIDDLLQTGGTMEGALNAMIDAGTKDIIAGVTHLRMNQGYNRVRSKVSKLYSSDSNPANPNSNLSIAGLVKDTIKESFYK